MTVKTRYWHKDGKPNGTTYDDYTKILHREDGPAIVYENGDEEYFINGKRHRLDGPAINWQSFKAWFLNDEQIRVKTNEDFLRIVKLRAFL